MSKDPELTKAKQVVLDNLDVIQLVLVRCVNEGMIDTGDEYYNQLLDLINEASILKTWDELAEVVSLAKTLEADVAAWLSYHGRTSVSLSWPHRIKS